MKAVLFDCDGVLVDTEREGHRVAFNRAFALYGLSVQWEQETYGRLLAVAGGKERMRHFFDQNEWPERVTDREAFIKDLHRSKTDEFTSMIEGGQLPLRPGVARLVDEIIGEGLHLGVCSTSNERAVTLIVELLLGRGRREHFDLILAGDVVSRKKPDPEIYNLAKGRLGLRGEECLVIEDSRNGLLAAKAAGMRCVVTTNAYTEQEDFASADGVFPGLDTDDGRPLVTLQYLKGIA